MENVFVRFFGWRATILHGDPTVADRWEWVQKHLKPGPLSTLEAGCGTGAMTLYAAKIGNQAIGLSFNERNNEVARERARILKLEGASFRTADLRHLEKEGLEGSHFDQILCLETIEHVIEDGKLLKGLSDLLKPGGRLLLTTPFKGHYPLIGEPQDPEFRSETEDGGHVRFGYTAAELRSLCKAANLEVVSEDFISGYVSQRLYTAFCMLDKYFPHKLVWLLTLPVRILRRADKALTQWLRYPHLSIGIVARKSP